MKQYIDKSALVAEIEKKTYMEQGFRNEYSEYGYHSCARDILAFLDTLEVDEEVDLEKETELIANSIMIPVQANLYHTNIYNFEKRCFKHSDLKEAARKGFELGLKAKGE